MTVLPLSAIFFTVAALLSAAIGILFARCTALETALQVLYDKHARLAGQFAEVQRRKFL